MIRITETARDAMQGIKNFIPTANKLAYVNALLQVGFDTLDVGSFVSPKVIPQMADTRELIQKMNIPKNAPEIMVLVVNKRGTEDALRCERVQCLTYPYSISPTFLMRNLNADEAKALGIVKEITELAFPKNRELVIYLSMALGNPYGDDWSIQMVIDGAAQLYDLGIRRMPLSDILGEATPDTIFKVYEKLIPAFPEVDFGLHLHTKPSHSYNKLEAAWEAGVRSYETVFNGLGGCPTAADEMVGNLSTQDLLHFCDRKKIETKLNRKALNEVVLMRQVI
ncbi:MAG: hydroxymethylglutaryl-CoA lyase [Bacteroidetes bacterium]|jgi:hydroxymethylglutaryl-CoA lyase|nr:hydroxymethylglutaryl-CoA lyase [Bacteroidota bacterium]